MKKISRLNNIEKRAEKLLEVDPEVALRMIRTYIDLSCEEEPCKPEEKTTLYEFIWWVNHFLDVVEERNLQSMIELWWDIEAGIRDRGGFKPDEKDQEAEEIRKYRP